MPGELERRVVTVLFCDLAGFTSLSERLDAEDVATVQGAYFAAVKDAVTRHAGTLEKFIGDAAVAVYGVPQAREDDAERAVRTGLAVVGAVEQLAARLGLEDGALQVRVGVHTGEAVVHPDPGEGEALVTGDVVNTAARLQAAATPGAVLAGAGTALAVASAVELEDVGALTLKGKSEPVPAFRVLATLAEPERDRAMGGLRAPTIGRDDVLARLRSGLEECGPGRRRLVTLVAPPGTGKSRVLQELAQLAPRVGASARGGRVRPDALAAFRPVAELVSAALASAGVDASRLAVLEAALVARLGEERGGAVASELAELVGGFDEGATAGEADARRTARFAAWSEGLEALGDGPELWLVEDVHWAAPDFLAFLSAAVADGRTARGRFVVCTSRPSLLETQPDWVAGGGLVVLEPLSRGSVGDLVRALVGDSLSEELARDLAERSGGNPLFVEELLRSWVGSGLLEPKTGGWRLRAAARVELPATVQSIYAAQLDDLPAGSRALVRRASVAGRRFPVDALESLGVAGAGLESLERRGVVHGPVPDPVLGDTYSFRHALLRDVGYASLSRAERALLHVRMARWLEVVAGSRAAEVAEVVGRHYAAALESAPALAATVGDDLDREDAATLAATWFERAGEAALAASAYDSARTLFERSLGSTAPDRDLERGRRLVGLSRAVAFTSDMDAGLRAAEEALGLLLGCVRQAERAEEGDARAEAARAVALVGAIYAQQLRFADAVALAEDALRELGDRGDAATARVLLTHLRGAAMIGDEAWEAAAPRRRRALEITRAVDDPALELETRMWTVWDEKDLPSAWAEIEELALRQRRWSEVADARRTLCGLCLPDDLDGAVEAANRLRSFAAAHQLEEHGGWADYYVAEAEFARGDWDAAVAAGTRALDVADAGSYHRVAARTWFVVVPIAAAREDRALLERAVAWYRPRGLPDTPYGRLSRSAVDSLVARAGLASSFRVELGDLETSIAEGGSLPSWLEAVDVVAAAGLADGQVPDARRALELFAAALERYPSAAGEAARVLLEARVRLAADDDVDAVREAVDALRAHGAPWPLLKCLLLLGPRATAAEEVEEDRLRRRLGLAPAVR